MRAIGTSSAYIAVTRERIPVRLVKVVGEGMCATCAGGFPGGFALEFADGADTLFCLGCSHDAALHGGMVAV